MPTYGVTAEGFTRPSVQEILDLIETDQRAEISQTLDLSTDSVVGQLNGIYARHLGMAWEALEAAYHAFDPDRAEDDRLTSLAKITGTERRGASKSEIIEDVTLDPGTTLLAGVHFVHVTGKPDVRFTPQADFTAPGIVPATYQVPFESENTGAVQAPAGTLNVIATPVVGWSAANNPLTDATLGRDIDTDDVLRLRREEALARAGSSTVDAIRADVLAVEDVKSVQVFENYTDSTDANGLPGKSFEVVLWDDAGAIDNAIAQAIWQSKAGGIQPYGAIAATATDTNGDPQTVKFSRASAVLMYVDYDLVPKDNYVGDAAFKIAVATALDAALGTGQDVSEWDIMDAAHGLGAKITQVRFGTAANPTTQTEVAIGVRQIARFDSSRIVLNG